MQKNDTEEPIRFSFPNFELSADLCYRLAGVAALHQEEENPVPVLDDPVGFVKFLEKALSQWYYEVVPEDERASVDSMIEERHTGEFEYLRSGILNHLAIPFEERTEMFDVLLSSLQSWFRSWRVCPNCGRGVSPLRTNRLFCSRKCANRFSSEAARLRAKRKAGHPPEPLPKLF